MPLESSLAISISESRVGTMIDTNTLSIGFLPPILMLIFIHTLLLSALLHFIYAPSRSSLRYNVTHICATITVLFLPFLKSLCLLHLLFQSFPTVFQSFTVLPFLLYLLLCPTAQIEILSLHWLSSLQKYRCFLFRLELRNKQIFAILEFKRYFGLMI